MAVVLGLPAPRRRVRRARDRGAGRRRAPPRPGEDARGDHGRHAARGRLQPEQPDLDRAAARRDRGVRRRRPAPRRRDPRRGLLRVQHPPGPRRVDPAARHATRTSCCCGRSRRSTGCAGCASASRSAARRPSAPRSTRCASRSSATPPRRPPRSRRSTTRTRSPAASSATSPSGSGSRTACAGSASRPPSRRPTSSGSTCPSEEPAEAERDVLHGLAAARRSSCAAATSLGRAGALRVTVGTEAENERFLEALGRAAVGHGFTAGPPLLDRPGGALPHGTPHRVVLSARSHRDPSFPHHPPHSPRGGARPRRDGRGGARRHGRHAHRGRHAQRRCAAGRGAHRRRHARRAGQAEHPHSRRPTPPSASPGARRTATWCARPGRSRRRSTA